MERRGFLKKLFMGTAALGAVAVAPEVFLGASKTLFDPLLGNIPADAVIGKYANYVNFSDFAIAQAIDESVEKCALELGQRAGQSQAALLKAVAEGWQPVALGRL